MSQMHFAFEEQKKTRAKCNGKMILNQSFDFGDVFHEPYTVQWSTLDSNFADLSCILSIDIVNLVQAVMFWYFEKNMHIDNKSARHKVMRWPKQIWSMISNMFTHNRHKYNELFFELLTSKPVKSHTSANKFTVQASNFQAKQTRSSNFECNFFTYTQLFSWCVIWPCNRYFFFAMHMQCV